MFRMKYELIPPPAYLKSYVRFFWTLEGDDNNTLTKTFGSLVDGCPGLIFRQPDAGVFLKENQQLPDVFLYGQTTRHTEIASVGNFRSTGVIFHPNALKSIFGMNAVNLTDTCVDVELLPGQKKVNLSEQLADTASSSTQVEILSAYLHTKIANSAAPADTLVEYAVSQIVTSNGNVSLKELMNKLQFTERTFERKFKEYVGITPKLFSRICQYQASLHQLKNNNYGKLSDIAFENDYADQSHFIRSFKEFTGCSPFQFQKQLHEANEKIILPR